MDLSLQMGHDHPLSTTRVRLRDPGVGLRKTSIHVREITSLCYISGTDEIRVVTPGQTHKNKVYDINSEDL